MAVRDIVQCEYWLDVYCTCGSRPWNFVDVWDSSKAICEDCGAPAWTDEQLAAINVTSLAGLPAVYALMWDFVHGRR